MTHVLLTGADGYIGQALAVQLAARLRTGQIASLTLADLRFGGDAVDAVDAKGLRRISGDLGEARMLDEATAAKPSLVFHLAGITSRAAEDNFALGLQVNVTTTMALFERLRLQGQSPVVVCASSIGVYGAPLPDRVDDLTPAAPTLSYGAQKRMMEILLADYSRRGWLDGRTVRLPSVVARPREASGALSSFASDLVRELAAGHRYTCPIGPDGTLWMLSLQACVEHLLLAAALAPQRLPAGRAWNLPALRVSARDVVEALCRRFGPRLAERVTYQPQADMQAQFAAWPALFTPMADSLGMRHDGNLDALIARSLPP